LRPRPLDQSIESGAGVLALRRVLLTVQASMNQHPRERARSNAQLLRLPCQSRMVGLVKANGDCPNHDWDSGKMRCKTIRIASRRTVQSLGVGLDRELDSPSTEPWQLT
jgi:hypothetical protein